MQLTWRDAQVHAVPYPTALSNAVIWVHSVTFCKLHDVYFDEFQHCTEQFDVQNTDFDGNSGRRQLRHKKAREIVLIAFEYFMNTWSFICDVATPSRKENYSL